MVRIGRPCFSARARFLAAAASQVFLLNALMTPGAGQQLASWRSTSSTPRAAQTSLVDFSIPGYLRGAMHPRKNAYFAMRITP